MSNKSYLTIYPSADLIEFLGGSSETGRHVSRGVHVDDVVSARLDSYLAEVGAQAMALDPDVEITVDYDQIRCGGATKDVKYHGESVALEQSLRQILGEAGEVAHGLRAATETVEVAS